MQLEFIDLAIIAAVIAVSVLVGLWSSRRAGDNPAEYFLSGRGMSGWLLGVSLVATTFAADTPGLVTELVRTHGVAGNWVWWAFLLTGMLTVFLFARMWRRTGVTTDLEFYELRYHGEPARLLRMFRAAYLGVVFNVIVMAVVSVAAIKIGHVMLGLSPAAVLLCGGLTALVLSTLGGLRAVVWTDCLLFGVAMAGSVAAAYFAVQRPEVGGLAGLLDHPAVAAKQAMLPGWDWSTTESRNFLMTVLLMPLLVQWWSVWYPSAEPGGGGYLAQRMLAAKDEDNALGAVMLFNVAHYALRPWPWILVALASLVVYPELADLERAFPQLGESKLGHDLAYPAMLTSAPAGWRGLILASLLSAYVSTISTQLNWGSSYITNDFYKPLLGNRATDAQLVLVGRVATVAIMLLSSGLALYLQTAKQGFDLLLSVGAGTGLVFVLRWYWWRINAVSEIVAMIASVAVAALFQFVDFGLEDWQVLGLSVGATTLIWLAATLLTRPEPEATLLSFCRLVHPRGPGWRSVYTRAEQQGSPITTYPQDSIPLGLLRMALGTAAIYAALFAVGAGLYGQSGPAVVMAAVATLTGLALSATFRRKQPTANR
ncbi:Sodium/glucose cotransporter [Posidoniimonas corsicana]|uniref:Sodium/glucose cotransporter n=1 Tax=Posidoniimonas corsicana TaxID=1938618 RepID=A0A5C5UZG4_9BACT|nr:sodium:solute symporter family protein [Posidoniimonas corsicana]TWT31239.1 Sodium/glucose cotransporter [Posidoniimonas corsicana]